MKKRNLTHAKPAVRWAARTIAEGEGSPLPSPDHLVEQMKTLAAMVAEAPDAMLDAVLGDLLDLLKACPVDSILPVVDELLARRPDVIENALGRNTLGGRISHIEKTLYIAHLFSKDRVRALTQAAAAVRSTLVGRETVLE